VTNSMHNEVNGCGPAVIEKFVGNDNIKQRVAIALESAHYDGSRMCHTLMSGDAGLGKTTLSQIIAQEMGCELREQLGQNLNTQEELHGFLMDAADRDVLLIDEIQELPSYNQTALYRCMENGQIFLTNQRTNKSTCITLPNITIIGATTDEYCLMKPLRDRFKMVLQFDYYTENELEQLLLHRAFQLGWSVEPEVISFIAARGQGVPRIALRLLESVRRTARAENSELITEEHFLKTCFLEGLDTLGLTANQRKYLAILNENRDPVRLNIVATRLGQHPRTINQVIEPFLVRSGLINKDDKGRCLTNKGLEHVRTNPI